MSNTSLYTYQIRLEGHLEPEWSSWFAGLEISLEPNGETVLTGCVADQAALHGLIKKVRDIGIPLLSIQRITETNLADSPTLLQPPSH